MGGMQPTGSVNTRWPSSPRVFRSAGVKMGPSVDTRKLGTTCWGNAVEIRRREDDELVGYMPTGWSVPRRLAETEEVWQGLRLLPHQSGQLVGLRAETISVVRHFDFSDHPWLGVPLDYGRTFFGVPGDRYGVVYKDPRVACSAPTAVDRGRISQIAALVRL